MTLICLISDTHENESAITEAVSIIKKRNPALVLHLGDIVSPPVLENFKELKMRFIYGNNDGERLGLQKRCATFGWEISDTVELIVDDKKIFAAHGHRDDVNIAIKSGEFDVVFYGHTHVKRDEMVGVTRVINPGALFRASEYTFVFLDVESGKIEWVNLHKL